MALKMFLGADCASDVVAEATEIKNANKVALPIERKSRAINFAKRFTSSFFILRGCGAAA
jgi:hypothetical protein